MRRTRGHRIGSLLMSMLVLVSVSILVPVTIFVATLRLEKSRQSAPKAPSIRPRP